MTDTNIKQQQKIIISEFDFNSYILFKKKLLISFRIKEIFRSNNILITSINDYYVMCKLLLYIFFLSEGIFVFSNIQIVVFRNISETY